MDAALGYPALVALIAIALIFDALNGLHDADSRGKSGAATTLRHSSPAPQFPVHLCKSVLYSAYRNN